MSSYGFQPINSIDHRLWGRLAGPWLQRSFSKGTSCRVLVYGHADPICRSQIEPFFHNEPEFRDRFGAEFRYRPIDDLLSDQKREADVVLVQPWFTVDDDALAAALSSLRAQLPNARIIFLDSYAHNDLRLGPAINPYIDLYYKKSIFRDTSDYLVPRRGDTNLTEYYGELCNVEVGDPVDWQVPPSILPKLRLSPDFFTANRFVDAFATEPLPPIEGRTIDVQSRLGGKGTPWYTAMRKLAQDKIAAVDGISLSSAGHLSISEFMAELKNSKLCFSPFGYGELCWRDIEAFQTGAVLIKPDMGHLSTLPDLFEAGVTYLPVRWDFSDLEDVIRGALADEDLRRRIATEAWARVSNYLRDRRFVDDMAEIFE